MIYLYSRAYINKDFLIVVFGAIVLATIINPQLYSSSRQKRVDEVLGSITVRKTDASIDKKVVSGSKEPKKETTTNLSLTVVGVPINLTIPSIGVNANIYEVGLAADGSIKVPNDPNNVGWFSLGPKPGEIGSAVIAGHYGQWFDGRNSVFINLHKLSKGDIIYIKDYKGKVLSFMVKESRIYDLESYDPSIFSEKDGAYLNIITCSGSWISNKSTYDKRLVIFTELLI